MLHTNCLLSPIAGAEDGALEAPGGDSDEESASDTVMRAFAWNYFLFSFA